MKEGQQDPREVVAAAREVLESEPLLRVEYVELTDADTLRPVETVGGNMLLAVAVRAGKTRLIDNVVIRP